MEAVNVHSRWVKDEIFKDEPNIEVEIHPRRLLWPWSHHEKLCVVDENDAFLGGIDLCAGRWDKQEHPLHDRN